MISAFYLILALSTAEASNLATSFLGQTWGPRPSFPAPCLNCIANPEPLTRWGGCKHKVGDLPLAVSWAYGHKILFGAVGRAFEFSTCQTLEATLKAAWGPGTESQTSSVRGIARTDWAEGEVVASLGPSVIPTVECEIVVVHLGHSQAVRAIEAEKAASRAAGI